MARNRFDQATLGVRHSPSGGARGARVVVRVGLRTVCPDTAWPHGFPARQTGVDLPHDLLPPHYDAPVTSAEGTPNLGTETAKAAPPLLERLGVRYFRALSGLARPAPQQADSVHVLNADERAGLRRVERGAVLRAAAAGAISAVVSAGTEVLATPLLGADPSQATWEDRARFWAIVAGVTALASILEILYLYWDSLRAVHRLSVVAGLELFPEHGDAQGGAAVAAALARAALELPNPAVRVWGVDPHREASKLRLVVVSLLYKLKISASNFVLKALMGRALGRAVARTWLAFVAVPVTAAWNAIVTWLVMREARIRAMGPSAASEMIGLVLASPAALTPAGRLAVVRAVASAIVRTEDMHPNLVAVLDQVVRRVGETGGERVDDSAAFLLSLGGLALEEKRAALRVLTVAAIIDGRLSAAERRLIHDAQVACGASPDHRPAGRLRRRFLSGEPIDLGLLETLDGLPRSTEAVAGA